MSPSEPSRPKRLSITLDPSLVLERLILRRLADLPRMRRLDWLRALLAQGFLVESRLLRVGTPDMPAAMLPGGTPKPEPRVAGWALQSHASAAPLATSTHCAPVPRKSAESSARKPFAQLCRVIG